MALKLALDTNRYGDYVTGVAEAYAPVVEAEEVCLPFIVLGELRAGFQLGSRLRENERGLQDFLRTDRVRVLYADEATTHYYADIFADLRRAGTPIPTHDIWIAALVIQHGLTLFTRDRHFEKIPRVSRV